MKPVDQLITHAGFPQAGMLLDAASLSTLLGREVRIVHLRIKPGHNVIVAWQETSSGEYGWTEATCDRDKIDGTLRRAGRIAEPVTVHENGEVYIYSGSIWTDRKLAKALRGLPRAGLRILRYNPHRRLVAATADGLVVRVHADSATHLGQTSARWQELGVSAISMFGTATMAISPWWGIGDLQSVPSVAGSEAAGREVARLHSLGRKTVSEIQELVVDADAAATAVAEVAPWLSDSARALGERLSVLLPQLSAHEPLTELHGDLSPDQILLNERGEVRLIDFDRSGAGPASRDIGNYLAFCRQHDLAELREGFLQGYREAGGQVDWVNVAAWEAYALLMFATSPVRRGERNWLQQVEETLALTHQALDLVPPRVVELANTTWQVNRAWRDRPDALIVELKHPDSGEIRAATWGAGGLQAYATGEDPKLEIPAGQLVSHRAQKRAVLRSVDGTSYSKIVRAGKAHKILAGLTHAQPLTTAFRMPEVLATNDSTVTFAALGGKSLHQPAEFSDSEWQHAWAQVMAGLEKTWASETTGGPVHSAAEEEEVLRAWVGKALAFVDKPGALLNALEQACAGLSALPAPQVVPCHRDLHSKQLLWSPELGPGLLDVDTACLADPAVDLGNLRAHALWRERQGVWHPQRTAMVIETIDRVDADPVAVRAYEYATLVRLVCVYAFRPTYRAQAMALLADLRA